MTREQAIQEYYQNPNKCLFCSQIINISEKEKVYDVKRKKFCNRSCAASHNNKGKKRGPHLSGSCKICLAPIRAKLKYCMQHRKSHDITLLLTEHQNISRQYFKKRLLRNGLLENKCYICEAPPFWREHPMILILDHINGINDDYRLSNLRLLCPNCNSQTPTFSGRNIKLRTSLNLITIRGTQRKILKPKP
jgi:hypothetical protein